MATPVASVPEYCAALIRSKLLTELAVRDIRQRWKAEAKTSDTDVDGFRKFLLRDKLLTEYQAALLQRGRADGFYLGDYVILDRIGSGQSAGVYKAKHVSGQVVAIKVLSGSKAREPNTLNRFQREGRLLTQLNHPNTVRAFQVGQTLGTHFIVMEHLEGETLDTVLEKRKKLQVAEGVRLIHQAFQGLQHLHERRMIHRDLKPANLMLTPPPIGDTFGCTVKILDIGLGRELFDEASPATQDNLLTSEGALLGTPDYLAPEQARDARTSDIRADIYSLGCVLYQLLAGCPPFSDSNVMAQMVKHATAPVPPLGDVARDVPTGLSNAVNKLLAKKPEDRPQTPAEAAELIGSFMGLPGQRPESSTILPAYKDWLESEMGMEMPSEVQSAAVQQSIIPTSSNPAPAVAEPAVGQKKQLAVASKPLKKFANTSTAVRPSPPQINVELVTIPKPKRSEDEDEPRSVLDFDRRDWLMLGAGGFLMLLAIGLGYAVTWVLNN